MTRIDAIRNMIVAGGSNLCRARNDIRDVGDFLVGLRRKYVLPTPGGLFPDVLFVKEDKKQDGFEHVRFAMKVCDVVRSLVATFLLVG